jgi:hypothetical protein
MMGHVRRILTLGLAWVAAAVVAAVVAWQGVGLIGAQVTDSRPETLSAEEIDAALSPVQTTTAPTDAGDGSADTGSTTTASGQPGDASTSTSVGGSASSTTTTPPATTPPVVDRRTATMVGGTAAFEYSDGTVRIVYASPKPGYRLERQEEDDAGARVEFKGDAGTSRADAWWDGGPQLRIADHGEDSGDDDGHGGSDDD